LEALLRNRFKGWPRRRTAGVAGEIPGAGRAMEARAQARGVSHPKCCLGLEREFPFRTAGKMDKPLRC